MRATPAQRRILLLMPVEGYVSDQVLVVAVVRAGGSGRTFDSMMRRMVAAGYVTPYWTGYRLTEKGMEARGAAR